MDNPKPILEALLFVSPEPLTVKEIRTITPDLKEKEISGLVDELAAEYEARGGGLQIVQVAGGYRMLTRLECSPWLKKLKSVTVSSKLSQPAMETLAIVAYKQPVIRAEIDHIRGVNSDGVLKTLLDRKLVKILGRKEMPGRPLLYGTTTEFLEYFGLKDITELPTLRDIEDFEGEGAAQLTIDDVRELNEEIDHAGDEPPADAGGMAETGEGASEAPPAETGGADEDEHSQPSNQDGAPTPETADEAAEAAPDDAGSAPEPQTADDPETKPTVGADLAESPDG